jgi:hypothetical protein
MSFRVIDADQRSPEWFAARLGRLTGSRAGDMLATIKSGEAAARRDYRMQLVCERLTGTMQEDGFVSAAMQRGVECEPLARDLYERHTGRFIQTTGFLASIDHMAGCSLDGHVGDYDGHATFEGIVELKCPKSATHLCYLRSNVVPAEHIPQILHNLWITGAAWCDFVSFDDRFDAPLTLWIKRVERNEQAIAEYAIKALAFLAEVETEENAIRTMRDPGAVLREAVAS